MGLETAAFIDELVATNPIGATDPKSQGDDHLRVIKTAIQGSLPNFVGALESSNAEIDAAVTVVAALPLFDTGNHTPTVSNGSNIGTFTEQTQNYIRVGAFVAVVFKVRGVVAATGDTSFQFTLPVASNLALDRDVMGAAGTITAGSSPSAVVGCIAAADRVSVAWVAQNTGSTLISGFYLYEIKA